MANKPIQIDTWTTSEGEFCARFCINRGHHPFGVARGIFRTLSEMHPGEMYELVSLCRSYVIKTKFKQWFVARFKKGSYE